jgi:conjugal transfer/type IV secretion protein DotA/TraY
MRSDIMSNTRRPTDGVWSAKKRNYGVFGVLLAVMVMFALSATGAMAQPITTSGPLETFTSEEAYGLFGTAFGDPFTSVFLNQLFGPLFPSASGSVSQTVFSSVIGYFNIITIVVGGLLFFYNVTVGLVQSAHEGSILGRNWSSLWAPIRVIFAVGLMVPMPNLGGYNLAQSGVAFIVRGSTLMASTVWSASAELVISGRLPIVSAPPTMEPELIKKLYLNGACKAIIDFQMAAAAPANTQPYRVGTDQYQGDPAYRSANSGTKTVVTGLTRPTGTQPNAPLEPLTEIGICGSYTTPELPDYINRINEVDSQAIQSIDATNRAQIADMFAAAHVDSMETIAGRMDTLTLSMMPVVRQNGSTLPNIAKNVADAIVDQNKIMSTRMDSLMEIAVGTASRQGDDARAALLKRIKGGDNCKNTATSDLANKPTQCYSEGWIGAGSWYMLIAQMNNEIASLTEAKSTATSGEYIQHLDAKNRNLFVAAGGDSAWMPWNRSDQYANVGMLSQDQATFMMSRFEEAWTDSVSELAALGMPLAIEDLNSLNNDITNADSVFNKFPKLSGAVDGFIMNVVEYSSPSNWGSDPMIGITQIGRTLMNAAGILIVGAALGGALSSGIPLMLAPFVAVFMTAGSLMNFILPIMPFFYWVLAVTGYFLLIAEAIVAVNLWALAHMRMDGDGISGQAGQYGWLMFLSLLVTPVLMVFGFLLGMGIFRVTSALIDIGINQAFTGILGGGIFIKVMAMFVFSIFMSVIYIVMLERSFSLVSEFPGKVLRWMGAGAELTSGEEKMARGAAAAGATGVYAGAGKTAKLAGDAGSSVGNRLSQMGNTSEGKGDQEGKDDGDGGGSKRLPGAGG